MAKVVYVHVGETFCRRSTSVRLSVTFTANGKRQKGNVFRLSSAVSTVE